MTPSTTKLLACFGRFDQLRACIAAMGIFGGIACGGRTDLDDGLDLSGPAHSGCTGGAGAWNDTDGPATSGVTSVGTGGVGTGGVGTGGVGTGGVNDADGGIGGNAAEEDGGSPDKPPLWRTSREAYCGMPSKELNAGALWSDSSGVYLLTAAGFETSAIELNDGSGWSTFTTAQVGPASASLTGFIGGPLVEYGGSACAIDFVDKVMSRCSAASSQVSGVFIVNARSGYAVYQDRLLSYDGKFWTQSGPPLPGMDPPSARAVWASDSTVAVVANAGRIYLQQFGQMTLQVGTPTGDYSATWGFAANDIWAGNDQGQLVHYDGTNWSVAAQLDGSCPSIRYLWGSEGSLFFTTDKTIGVVEAGYDVRILASHPCDSPLSMKGLWGNAKSEVFFAMQSIDDIDSTCAGIELSWFNGETLSAL